VDPPGPPAMLIAAKNVTAKTAMARDTDSKRIIIFLYKTGKYL
jgi:hypothetical protein